MAAWLDREEALRQEPLASCHDEFYDYLPSADSNESRFLGEMVFYVDVEHGLHPCPVCGNLCKVKEYEVRKYYHTRTLDCKTAIIAKVPKLRCPVDGYP